MSDNSIKHPSQRQLKVGEELRHAISEIFMREDIYIPDTRKTLQVTVSEVRISPDLRNATVYIMPLGGDGQDNIIEIIDNISGYIRSLISKKIRMKYAPTLFFKLDDLFDKAMEIETILNRDDVKRDLKKIGTDEDENSL